MNKFIAAFALCSTLAMAETWSGTVIDVACKNNDLAGHTRDCALKCSRTGYGIVLADGKFIKFDERGNIKTLAALKASGKEKDLKARVTGKLSDDLIAIEAIEIH